MYHHITHSRIQLTLLGRENLNRIRQRKNHRYFWSTNKHITDPFLHPLIVIEEEAASTERQLDMKQSFP